MRLLKKLRLVLALVLALVVGALPATAHVGHDSVVTTAFASCGGGTSVVVRWQVQASPTTTSYLAWQEGSLVTHYSGYIVDNGPEDENAVKGYVAFDTGAQVVTWRQIYNGNGAYGHFQTYECG